MIVPSDTQIFSLPQPYLDDLERQYKDNPYHCWGHAVEVATLVHTWVKNEECLKNTFTHEQTQIMILAALSHDLGHPGTNNQYQEQIQSELFTKYGKDSTLEKYSIDLGKQTLERHNILDHLHIRNKGDAIAFFDQMILHTDMMYHRSHITQLEQHIECSKQDSTLKINPVQFACILLHAADINSCFQRPFDVFMSRSNACNQEFYAQGDGQRDRHLPISKGMDRGYDVTKLHSKEELKESEAICNERQTQSEIDFVEKVAQPFFVQLQQVWPYATTLCAAIEMNLADLKAM